MKKIVVISFFLLCIFCPNSATVEAHSAGMPFFKINGVYTDPYPAPQSNISDVLVPQDKSPRVYLIGEKLHCEIDTNQLGVSQKVGMETNFIWDMGDGTKKSGIQVDYAYTKAGSYLQTIHADYKDNPTPRLIQSTLIDVASDENFQKPKAHFSVNKTMVVDPRNEVLAIDYTNPLTFSIDRATYVESVVWDFGDGVSGSGETVSHQYHAQLGGTVFPIVAVKFKNGYADYSYVQIDNTVQQNPTKISNSLQKESPIWGTYVVFAILIAFGGGCGLLSYRFLRNKSV